MRAAAEIRSKAASTHRVHVFYLNAQRGMDCMWREFLLKWDQMEIATKFLWMSLKSTWKRTNQISKEWMYVSAQKLHMDDLPHALDRVFIQSRGGIHYTFSLSRWAHGCQTTMLSSGISMTLSHIIIVILQPLKIMLAIKKSHAPINTPALSL